MSEIFVLSGDLGFARFDRDELTAPDPAIRHFLLAFGYVEAPSGIGLDERQRQGPTPTRRIFSPLGPSSIVVNAAAASSNSSVLGVLVSVA